MKDNKKIKIGIVSGAFWKDIVTDLEKSCVKEFEKNSIKKSQIDIFRVPGSLEIPLAVKKLAKKNVYDVFIVFGAIHKGKTYHFELIANETARACMDLSLQYEVPVIFEVLAVYDIQDAIDRSKGIKDNRGIEAAQAALEMIKLLPQL